MEETKNCPYCGEEIKVECKKCPYCGEELNDEIENCTESRSVNENIVENKNISETFVTIEKKEKHPGFFEYYFYDVFIKHYADFSSKIGRKQYWIGKLLLILFFYFTCVSFIFIVMATGEEMIIQAIILLPMVALFIPSISMDIRRLHDCGKNGNWGFLYLISPVVFYICTLVWLVKKGETSSIRIKWNKTDSIICGLITAFLIIVIFTATSSSGVEDSDDKILAQAQAELLSNPTITESEIASTNNQVVIVSEYKSNGHVYKYFLNKKEYGTYENAIHQHIVDTDESFQFNLEDFNCGDRQIMINSIADYMVKNEKIIIIGDNGATGRFAGQYVIFLDMSDESLNYVDFGDSAEFINNGKQLKVTKMTLLKEGTCEAENEYTSEDTIYDL